MLYEDGRVDTRGSPPEQKHPRKGILASKFSELKPGTWGAERDMYPDVVKAMKEGLYEDKENILVVDTHQNSDFHADIAVAEYEDSRLIYSLRYFLELKHPTVGPRTAEYCGQILDYFHAVREKQPHRSLFVAILSNFSLAWVYVASFSKDGPKIYEYPCRTLADAVVYAEVTSNSQFKTSIPRLDGRFQSNYNVLAVGKHYFLLSVINPPAPLPARTSARNKATTAWKSPSRHCDPKGQFVMKIAHDSCSLENEIRILEKIRNAQCLHLPELVWAPKGNKELGIMPLGVPIRPPESPIISRKIIQGMIEGLRYLHGQHIIHRDIRLSNLILQRSGNDINVVIIDYETAYDLEFDAVEYSGGYLCWPRRLLETGTELYTPEAADDLYASILVVLHMLFPRRFDDFNAGEIRSSADQTPETLKMLQVWKDIEASKIWGRFYVAARDLNYDALLEMSDIFCHV